MFDTEVWLRHAPELHAYDYFGVLIAVALLEWIVPRRSAGDSPGQRWMANFGATIITGALLRLLLPAAGLALALVCADRGWGLFNRLDAPGWLAFAVCVLALDFATYTQHYLLHRFPVLWRIHRMHHTDQEYDFSTGARFHPLEAFYSTAMISGAIVLLGAPPAAVLVSQLLTTAANFIEHANVRLPKRLDSLLRLVFVTPDMHRIHHSRDSRESRSNFANIFSWWDRLFGTYIAQPAAGHDGMQFGVPGFLERKHMRLSWMLVEPFLAKDDGTGRSRRPSGTPGDAAPQEH